MRHHRSAIVAATVLVVVWAAAVAFRIAGPHTVLDVDRAWNTWIGHARSPALVQTADVLAFIGTGLPAVVITLVAAVLAGLLTRRAVTGAYVVVVSGVSAADTWLMKTWRRGSAPIRCTSPRRPRSPPGTRRMPQP